MPWLLVACLAFAGGCGDNASTAAGAEDGADTATRPPAGGDEGDRGVGASVDETASDPDGIGPPESGPGDADGDGDYGDGSGAYTDSASDGDGTWPLLNVPPVLAAMPDLWAEPGEEVSVLASAWDSEGTDLIFFAPVLPQGARLDGESGRLRWRPKPVDRLTGPMVHDVVMGVMDHEGAEVLRGLRFRVAVPGEALPGMVSPRIDAPDSGIAWPTSQPWQEALDVRDGGPGPWRFSAGGRTPSGLELDANTGVISWRAPGGSLEPVTFTVRFTNGEGQSVEEELLLQPVEGRFDALPELRVPVGEQLRLPVAVDAPGAVCEAFGTLPEGITLHGCELRGPEFELDARGTRASVRVRIRRAGETRVRLVSWRIVDANPCPQTSGMEVSLPAVTVLGELATVDLSLCEQAAREFSHTFQVEGESRWVEAFADLPGRQASRVQLALSCGDGDTARSTRSGGTLAVRQRVEGAAQCELTVKSSRPLDQTRTLRLGLRAGSQPLCTRSTETPTLGEGDVLVRRICPGESLRVAIARGVDLVESTVDGILVDTEWLLVADDGVEVHAGSRLGLGFAEELWPIPGRSAGMDGADRAVLRLNAWLVPWRGGDLVLRAGESLSANEPR